MERKVKFQRSLEESPYDAGRLAGMQMDTIPEALENLQLSFGRREVSLSPWLARVNTYDLYWADKQGNFISEVSRADQEEFERGIHDWLRSVRKEGPTRQLWPITETERQAMVQFGPIRLTPGRILEILEEGRKRLSPDEFEELTNLLLDVRAFGLTPWANVRITELILRMQREPQIAPEWTQALEACDGAFLGDELRKMAREVGVSPAGDKKTLCAKLYEREAPQVVAVMAPYVKSVAIPIEQFAMLLPQVVPWESKVARLKSNLESCFRKDPKEFYRRKSLIEQATREREKGVTKTLPDFTPEELREVLRFTKRLYR